MKISVRRSFVFSSAVPRRSERGAEPSKSLLTSFCTRNILRQVFKRGEKEDTKSNSQNAIHPSTDP